VTGSVEYVHDPILDTEEMKKIFVGGIPTDSKDEELKEFFEEISGGSVTEHVFIRKENEKKSHFGFVTFSSSAEVDSVLSKRKELNFNGKTLDVNRAVPKNNATPGAHEKTKKLFIANLPKSDCSEVDLKEYFEARQDPAFGTIESVQLIKKKDDKGNKLDENKGYGFVMVSSEDMADKMAIQHATFEFGGRKIELKKSVPTGEGGGKRSGRGTNRGGFRGRGGGQYGNGTPYSGYGGYGYNQDWQAESYYGYYDYSGYPPYGGGYSAPPAPRGRGRGRYQPY
jgi:RNA recognition motif-containing protein